MCELKENSEKREIIWTIDNELAEKNKIVWKMLEHNSIPGIIPFEYFYINDRVSFRFFYRNLKKLCECVEKKNVQFDTLFFVIKEIVDIIYSGKEFLLKEREYLVEPEWIYWDYAEKKIYLCYLPGREDSERSGIIKFIEYMMEHTDHIDRKATKFIYDLYDLARTGGNVIDNLKSFITKFEYEDKDYIESEYKTENSNQMEGDTQIKSAGIAKSISDANKTSLEFYGKEKSEVSLCIYKPYNHKQKKIFNKFFVATKKMLGVEDTENIVCGMKINFDVKNESDVSVGRGEKCDICLPYPWVSSSHFTICRKAEKLYISDSGSKNGTFLNNKKIAPFSKVILKDGDRIRIGGLNLQLCFAN